MPQKELFHWEVRSFTVLLALDVVEALAREIGNVQGHHAEEQGGILFGRVIDDDNIEVDDFAFYPSGHRRGLPYDLNLTERQRIQRRLAVLNQTAGRIALGFFRTHLRPGLFLDQRDFTLMSETFSDCPGIALLIRPDANGRADAGVFFWEEGDMERKQSDLIFPFDADALRTRGPIEIRSAEPKQATAAAQRAEAPMIRKPLLWGVASGLASGVLAFGLLAELHGPDRQRQGAATPAPVAEQQTPPETLIAPPAVADAVSAGDDARLRSPFTVETDPQPSVKETNETLNDAPRPRWVAPRDTDDNEGDDDQPKRRTTAPPVQVAAIVTAPPAPAPAIVPATPTRVLTEAAAAPVLSPAIPPVTVDVSVEPKPNGVFKKITHGVGRVPLLGRLPGLRHENPDDLVVARPSSGLQPQIPADLRKSLGEDVTVDVAASIDETGAVTSAEITRGGESQLSQLAENAVRGASWKPARSGDRNVPMDVVVHYRFSPEREP